MSALDKLTEYQFHTVWTEAVGRNGYNKQMFRETLTALKEKGLIIETDLKTHEGEKQLDTESKCNNIVTNSGNSKDLKKLFCSHCGKVTIRQRYKAEFKGEPVEWKCVKCGFVW